jgi:predicted 3-demethylubiquinone-9 3-methyltransferase (glyoxalase superfamily)
MLYKIAPCLWFDGNAEEAARFYAQTFPDSRIDTINRSPSDYPDGKEGDVLTVEFMVLDMPFIGINAGPQFRFTIVNGEVLQRLGERLAELENDLGHKQKLESTRELIAAMERDRSALREGHFIN